MQLRSWFTDIIWKDDNAYIKESALTSFEDFLSYDLIYSYQLLKFMLDNIYLHIFNFYQ